MTGWECFGGDNTQPDICNPICGDGLRIGSEICDDWDTTDGEGCLPDCLGEIDGWTCSGGDETQEDICLTTCGDGF